MTARRRKARARPRKSRTLFHWTPAQKKTFFRETVKVASVLILGSFLYYLGTHPPQKTPAPAPAPQSAAPKTAPEPKTLRKETPVYPPPRVRRRTPAVCTGGPKLVFVIDDIGNNLNHEAELIALGDSVTYAILPLLPYSEHFSKLSRRTRAEVILHLPLETMDGTIPGPGLLTGRMPEKFVVERLGHNLDTVPDHVGANNHMGSRGTTDPVLMETILRELKRRGMFFLDSQTTNHSIAEAAGAKVGIPVLKRDVFLDNTDDPEAIRGQIAELEQTARRQGLGIGIGHIRHHTLTVLREEIPRLRQEGFTVLSLTEAIDCRK